MNALMHTEAAMRKLNRIENLFYTEFRSSMNLVSQPRIYKETKVFWRPDFKDINTDTYYEVVGCNSSFYRHKGKGHFDYTIEKGYNLVIAVYIHKIKYFLLFKYLPEQKLTIDHFICAIKSGLYRRFYGNFTELYTVQHAELVKS